MSELIRRDFDAELALRAPSEDGAKERIIEGIVVPWGEIATVRSDGEYKSPGSVYRESFARGAFAGLDPAKVTLESIEHKGKLVGRGIATEDRPEGQHMAFMVSKIPAGDELLALTEDKVLTSMSIVFAPGTQRVRDDGVVERTSATLRRVAVLERGAYPHAQVSAVRAEPAPQQEKKVDKVYVTPEDRASRIGELETLITAKAAEFPGVMPDEARAEFDAAVAERSQLVADQKAFEDRAKLIASFGAHESHREYTAPAVITRKTEADIYDLGAIRAETRTRDEYDQKMKEHALRSVDGLKLSRGASADQLVDIIENRDKGEEGTGEIARRVVLTGSPAYRSAFVKYLKNQTALWTPEEARAAALAVTGTTTTGGYAVPYVFDPSMIHIGVFSAENPFRSACRVETISNGNNWKAVTVGNIAMSYGTEASASVEGGPTFGQPSYTVQTAKGFVTLSVETLEDRPDAINELSSVLAEGKATLEENEFAVGAGTTVHPMGMFTDTAYTNQDTATNDVTAIADLQVLEGALPLRFRANAAFFMNRSTLRQLQALDTTYRYFSGAGINFAGQLQPNGNGGGNTGIQCLGYPVWEVPSAVSTLTTNSAIIVVFCDPKSYVIVDRVGMNVEVIPQMLNGATPSFPTLQRGLIAWFRNTAAPINADAGRSLSVQ